MAACLESRIDSEWVDMPFIVTVVQDWGATELMPAKEKKNKTKQKKERQNLKRIGEKKPSLACLA